MSDKFNVEFLEVGDTFVGGPIEQGDFILSVMAAGGEVEIDGDTVLILQLPKKAVPAPAPAPAPVEELSPAEDLAETEIPSDLPKPAPKPRGRKPKAAPAPVETVEE